MRRRTALCAALLLATGVLSACEGDTSGLGNTATTVETTAAPADTTTAPPTTAAPATKAPPSSTTTVTTLAAAAKTSQTTTATTVAAAAQTTLNPSLDANFGAVTLTAGFTPDPTSISLSSGGPESAAQVGCPGFVTASPDFELSWNGASSLLRIYFESYNQGDTTLVINAPDGSWWCGDDSFGTVHPTIDFPNPTVGVYDIWVGSYVQGDSHSGMLFFTELDGNGPTTTPTTAPPSGLQFRPGDTAPYGELTIQPGFTPDPFTTAITSGGQVDASYLGAPCAGFAATRPDLEITMAGNSQLLRFYFIPNGNSDSTLIINGPNGGWWCGDDSYGTLHPTLDFFATTAGTYDIWVGTYNPGDNTAGNLYMTEVDSFHP